MVWDTITGAIASTATRFGGTALNKINNMFNGIDILDTVSIHPSVTWSFDEGAFTLVNGTKKAKFNLANVGSGVTRNISVPDRDILLGPSVVGKQDQWIGAKDMNPTTTSGCSALTQRETTTNKNNYYVLDFDSSTAENAFFVWTPPRNWNLGTITAFFYWDNASGASTETVAWGIKAVALSDNDAFDVAFGTEIVVTDTWQAQNKLHITTESGAITIGGTPATNDCILFNIQRKTATDNLTGDARLVGVRLVYNWDTGVASA